MEDWKSIAVYAADVLAASGYELVRRKSTSKAERRRQIAIAQSMRDALKAGTLVKERARSIDSVIERLESVLSL